MTPRGALRPLAPALLDALGDISQLATQVARLPAHPRDAERRAELALACARATLRLDDAVRDGGDENALRIEMLAAMRAARDALREAEAAAEALPSALLIPSS